MTSKYFILAPVYDEDHVKYFNISTSDRYIKWEWSFEPIDGDVMYKFTFPTEEDMALFKLKLEL